MQHAHALFLVTLASVLSASPGCGPDPSETSWADPPSAAAQHVESVDCVTFQDHDPRVFHQS